MWSESTTRRVIVIGGCLGMVYTQLTMSPATIDYAQSLGADGLHIGILGALPVATLLAQFVAAVVVNHLQYRRKIWIALSVLHRLVHVPAAVGALLLPEWGDAFWLWMLVAATGLNHGMLHFCSPLWLSWMGDLLPAGGLSCFWGLRHRWQQWCGALALTGGAFLVYSSGLELRPVFAVLICVGAILGVVDALLFLKMREPPVERLPQPNLRKVLTAPFCDRRFRSFITFSCFFNVAAMVGSPFISLFLLKHLKMDLFHVLLLWAFSWGGGAMLSHGLGHLVDRFGHRPMLIMCTAFKSINMFALLVAPRDPTIAFWVLVPVFMLDALLNAGIVIANNGYLLKKSPRANRTMFIAAGTAVAGLAGGVTAIAAGFVLKLLDGWETTLFGETIVGFHVVFFASCVLRIASVEFARRIEEPEATGTRGVVMELFGATPLRLLRFPVGLYRTRSPEELAGDEPEPVILPLVARDDSPVTARKAA